MDHGMDVGGKTTVIRVPGNRLFALSVLPLDRETKAAIDAIGTVSMVVAPITQHIDFAKCWKKHYPDTTYLAPPGLKAAKPDLPFDDELITDGSPHESYKDSAGNLKQVYLGSVTFMGETVFFHAPSKTVIVTHLIFKFSSENRPFWTRFV